MEQKHNYQYSQEEPKTREVRRRRLSKRGLKQLGALALTAGAVAGWFGNDAYRDYKAASDQKIFESFSTSGLDNSPIDFSKLEKVSENGGILKVGAGDALRASTEEFFAPPETYNFSKTNHSAIGIFTKNENFKIHGEVYATKEGDNPKLVARIENFEKARDGKTTNINTKIDADGWVAVDATPQDLKSK